LKPGAIRNTLFKAQSNDDGDEEEKKE